MLNRIKQRLYNINKWYDSIPNGNRFTLFMSLVFICYIPSAILVLVGINNDFIIALPTLLLIPFGFIRVLWLTGRLRVLGK